MGISFLVVTLTGILKWPGLARGIYPDIANIVDFKLMSRIHDWSGIIMAVFVLVHLALNWSEMRVMASCIFKKKESCNVKDGRKKQ